jgi:pyrroline-5-carboxylate reductase
MMTTVFIGGGRITSALIAGLRKAQHEGSIIVHDRHPEKLRALKRDFAIEIEFDPGSAVAKADILILAVRPSSTAETLHSIGRFPEASNPLVVSLAAGVPLKKLRPQVKLWHRWTRALPSPICRIGRGLTAVAFDRALSAGDRRCVRRFFEQVGLVVELPENRLDAFNAAYSPAHGYHALAMLAKTAKNAGLDSKTALIAASHALADSIFYWRERGHNISELLQESATPGGTSAATLQAMHAAGYEKAVAKGLAAGIAQAQSNARRSQQRLKARASRRQPR